MTQGSSSPSPSPADPGPSAELLEAAQAHRHAAPVVTVFGGSRVERDSPAYQEAYEVGRLLAEHGYVVCNGGYSGTMEAASRGCKEAGGRTIGVTIEVLGRLAPNDFIDEEVGTASLLMRLDRLTADFDARVRGLLDILGSAATDMSRTSATLTDAAGSTSSQATSMAATAKQMSGNMQSVAAAAEVLGHSISEISEQVQRQSGMARSASDAAEGSREAAETIETAPQTIGIGVITLAAE